MERVLNCDLLILDDLGTEMVTTFVQSALYQIINGRLLEKKSTIVSTNLMPEAIAQRYSGQIASRIEGEYQLLPFVGEAIAIALGFMRSNLMLTTTSMFAGKLVRYIAMLWALQGAISMMNY